MELEVNKVIIKQNLIKEKINGFWSENHWDLFNFPKEYDYKTNRSNRYINFEVNNINLNNELKFALMSLIKSKKWTKKTLASYQSSIHLLMFWLNEKQSNLNSLITYDLEFLERTFATWLSETGRKPYRERFKEKRDENGNTYKSKFISANESINSLRFIHKELLDFYDIRSEFEKDIWDLYKLGKEYYSGKSINIINFSLISQQWLKEATKKYCRLLLTSKEIQSIVSTVNQIKTFSSFLFKFYPDCKPEDISREIIVEYLNFLSLKQIKNHTICAKLGQLRLFLEMNQRENWINISPKQIIFDEDYPKSENKKPRFIPESVMTQLNNYIDYLHEDMMRMVLIIQECGMRISELLTIDYNCLSQDQSSDYFLKTYMRKMKKEHIVPITKECALIIKEQQNYVLNKFGKTTKILFPQKYEKPMSQTTFSKKLNDLAFEKKIIDDSGRTFHFQSHMFRHTVGTRMINNGVPQHIVQRYLGHESPTMTSTYAHIHDQTLKKEFAEYQGKLVNIAGKIIEDNLDESNFSDLQWLKKNILAQSLPNGYCGLPVIQGGCPHANACLNCQHFRTDENYLSQHEKQIKETERLIEIAKKNGWQRQIEVNEQVLKNLKNIVATLQNTKSGSCGKGVY